MEHITAKEYNKLYGSNFKQPKEKKPKFGNKKIDINNEIFDSKFEAQIYYDLLLKQKSGSIKSIDKQWKMPLVVGGSKIGLYKCDFRVIYKDGVIEYLEAKSPITETDLWKYKWKLAQVLYSGKNIRFTVAMKLKYGYKFIYYQNLKKIK